jgi:predicted P-loop ATPase
MSTKSKKEPIRTEDIFDATDNRPPSGNRTKNQLVEDWLNLSYDFRYNIIKQKPEWREKTEKNYIPIDNYKLLSIKRELDAVGYTLSKDALKDIIGGSFSLAVNPVKAYFNALPQNDSATDYINELAATVTCKNADKWSIYLKKWLVAVVANVFIDEKCANHVMLVLTGEQGKFKTTWLENLCPKNLKQYMFSGKLNLESKDTLTLIAECLFVNIDDQLKQLHKKDENELKNIITVNNVKYRRPYDAYITDYPHLCSFMGSINGNDFLTDPTGSRRFMPFEVVNIDIEAAQKINMDFVWSQAHYLYRQRFKYYFNDQEIIELHENNKDFAVISQEEDLLHYYYYVTKPETPYCTLKHLPNAVILSYLETRSRLKLSSKKLGEALTKSGLKKERKTINGIFTWVYPIYEKTQAEIEQQEKA